MYYVAERAKKVHARAPKSVWPLATVAPCNTTQPNRLHMQQIARGDGANPGPAPGTPPLRASETLRSWVVAAAILVAIPRSAYHHPASPLLSHLVWQPHGGAGRACPPPVLRPGGWAGFGAAQKARSNPHPPRMERPGIHARATEAQAVYDVRRPPL